MVEYINRDALLQEIEQERRASKNSFPRQYFVVGDVLNCIRTAPAADVVEVRHGRWIEDERTHPGPGLKNNLCSVCGEIAGSWKEGLEPGRKWAYCPNCGTRMDKEDEQ